jgi:hypothetical protein
MHSKEKEKTIPAKTTKGKVEHKQGKKTFLCIFRPIYILMNSYNNKKLAKDFTRAKEGRWHKVPGC